MKKNKLIELLNTIEGNPEIVLWNGYAEDYMHIDPKVEPLTLVKETPDFIFTMLQAEYCRTNKTFDISEEKLLELQTKANELHKNREWDIPNEFVTEEEFVRWYGKRTRKLYVLNSKLRNKTSYGMDRSSDLKY